eukprot:1421538-Prymnesium_polylepis.1
MDRDRGGHGYRGIERDIRAPAHTLTLTPNAKGVHLRARAGHFDGIAICGWSMPMLGRTSGRVLGTLTSLQLAKLLPNSSHALRSLVKSISR